VLINITASSHLGLHEVNEACSIIREAAACEEVQINFGVIMNETMGDAVKITVIATGFQPENAPVAERRLMPEIRQQPRLPEPVMAPPMPPPPAMIVQPEPEPEVEMIVDAEPMLDLDDVETPAYLRQGRLLN
jgi:cell division protein FtsZ